MSSKSITGLIVWALAGALASLTGCGGGTQVASNTPASTPAASASTTQASQPEPSSGAESKPAEKPQASYGGESTSGNVGSANSGGSGGDYGSGMMGGAEPESSPMGPPGMGASGMGASPMGPPGMGASGMGASPMGPPGMGASGMGASPMGPPGMGTASMGAPGAGSSPMGASGSGGRGMSSGMGSGFAMEGESGGEMMGGELGGFGGPGGFGGTQPEAGFAMVVNFVTQNCVSCHRGNNAKAGVRMDRISPDISADSQLWAQIAKVLEDGKMPPRNSRQPDARQKTRVVEFIRETLGSVPESTFMERAEVAFRKGDVDKATQLFYAQLVTADDGEAAELANHIKLYRPVVVKPEDLTPASEFGVTVKPKLTTQLQLGVGIVLKLSGQVTDVMPVGASQLGNAAGAGGEMGGMDGPGRAGPGRGSGGKANANAANSKLENFEDLTGDVGQALLDAFESRRSSGNYGTLFSSLSTELGEDRFQLPGLGGDAGSGFGIGSEGGDDSGGLAGVAGNRGAGMGAAPPGMGSGQMGMGMGLGSGMGLGGGEDGENPGRPRNTKTRPGKALSNGLLYVGKADNTNSLLKKGTDAGLDGMFVIEIEASKNLRSNIVTNETRVKFMLASGKVVASGSKTLKNTDIERAIVMGKDSDDVQKQIDQLFNRLDSVLTMNDLPQIPAATALKQVQSRIHSDASRLQVLAEARMFNAKGFISNEQLEMVYQVVLEGNEGTTLASGSTDDRKLVLTSFTEKL